jgi:hypothetical protein
MISLLSVWGKITLSPRKKRSFWRRIPGFYFVAWTKKIIGFPVLFLLAQQNLVFQIFPFCFVGKVFCVFGKIFLEIQDFVIVETPFCMTTRKFLASGI